jgi:transcriptional regulator with XRE-family HTH domain
MPDAVYRSHREVLAEARKEPEFEKAYGRLGPLHQIIRDIVNLRSEKRLTQAELAKKAGTHQSRISKIESGEHDIQLSTLSALAAALDADLEVRLVSRQPDVFYATVLRECAQREELSPTTVAITEDKVVMQGDPIPLPWALSATLTRYEQANIS